MTQAKNSMAYTTIHPVEMLQADNSPVKTNYEPSVKVNIGGTVAIKTFDPKDVFMKKDGVAVKLESEEFKIVCPICAKFENLFVKNFKSNEDEHQYFAEVDASCICCKISFKFEILDSCVAKKILQQMLSFKNNGA